MRSTELEECNDLEFEEMVGELLEYPCVFLYGVTSEEELTFFRKRKVSSEVSVKMYTSVDGTPLDLGFLELTLDSLLAIRSIFDYKLTLCRAKGKVTEIDLDNPEELIKFIRL